MPVALSFRRLRDRLLAGTAIGLVAVSLAASPAPAAVVVWDGGGMTDNFSDGNNWNPNNVPGPGDNIQFNGNVRLAPNNDLSGFAVLDVFFPNTAGAFTIGGNGITLSGGAGGWGILSHSTQTQTFNVGSIALGSSQTWEQAVAGGALQVNSSVSLGAHSLTFNTANGSASAIGGAVSGTGGLTKTGDGTLTLSGDNTYTGATTVNQGTLTLQGTLSGQSALSIAGGATFIADNDSPENVGSLSGAGTLHVEPNSYFGVGADNGSSSFSGSITGHHISKVGTGTLTLTGTATTAIVEAFEGTLRLGGSERIGDTSNLSVFGGATFDLNGHNETVGSLSGSGDVTLGSGGTLTVGGNNADTDFYGVISGTGGFTKQGAGTLTLAGNNTYTGATTVNGGTLRIGADERIHDSSALVVNAGGTFDLAGNDETVGSLSGSGGVTLSGGGRLTFGGDNADTTFSGNVSSPGTMTKQGSGTFTIGAGADVAPGTLAVENGTLAMGGSNVIGNTTHLVIGGAGKFDNAGFGDTIGQLTNNGVFALNGGSLTVIGAFSNTGTATAGANNMCVGSVVNDFGAQLSMLGTVAGTIDNNGTLDLTGLLTAGGHVTNLGEVNAATGRTLRANGGMTNLGAVNLTGGALTGTGAVSNMGVVAGRGAVTAALTNEAGGTVRAQGGVLNVTNFSGGNAGNLQVANGATMNATSALTNTGLVTLEGTAATLGGANVLTNQGTIAGVGTVSKQVANEGAVRAEGGRLTVAAAGNSNAATGQIQAVAGGEVFYTQGLGTNAGTIALTGGAFDNNNHAMTNAAGGLIAGRGTIRTGGLVNDGSISLANGTTDVIGAVDNNASTAINDATVSFFGAFTNDGTLVSNRSMVNFLGGLINNGTIITDPNVFNIVGDFVHNDPAAVVAEAGDRFNVTGDMLGDTRNNTGWSTAGAVLAFVAGTANDHTIELQGVDFGASSAGLASNFAWGTVELAAGQSLALADAESNWQTGAGALYLDTILLADFATDILDGILNAIIGNGLNIYYNADAAGNAYLGGLDYDLFNGGRLIAMAVKAAVPAPASALALLTGLVPLLALRRRRRSG